MEEYERIMENFKFKGLKALLAVTSLLIPMGWDRRRECIFQASAT